MNRDKEQKLDAWLVINQLELGGAEIGDVKSDLPASLDRTGDMRMNSSRQITVWPVSVSDQGYHVAGRDEDVSS